MNLNTPTRDSVIQLSRSLPSFPAVIAEILSTLDDPDASIHTLVGSINRDPIISARILSVANTAAVRGRRESAVSDIATATSLIGLSRVRHITLISSLSTFGGCAARIGLPVTFWQHSVAMGVCCEEIAQHIAAPVAPSLALVAGLLHDIGQLWLHHFNALTMRNCWLDAKVRSMGIEMMEREHFGVDHCTVGAWLVEHWKLPASVVAAIGYHHDPDSESTTTLAPLVPLVHVAEVLSNALDLTGRTENQVARISSKACSQLGLIWNEDIRLLFGRIESRSSHANAFFDSLH